MWTRELVELLIILYQEHENSYNTRSPSYVDRIKRSESIYQICTALKEKNESLTVDLIKTKLHTLRTQYLKELRDFAGSKKSGVGPDDLHKPKLWCFDHLHFLKPFCNTRKGSTNISFSNESKSNSAESSLIKNNDNVPRTSKKQIDASTEDSVDSGFVKDIANKRKLQSKRKPTSALNEGLTDVKTLLMKRLKKNNEYDWLGEQVVFDLSAIKNDQLRRDTIWNIQSVLKEALLEDRQRSNSLQFNQISEEISNSVESQSEIACTSFRPISSLSENACSQDILQQSMYGVFSEEDFIEEDYEYND